MQWFILNKTNTFKFSSSDFIINIIDPLVLNMKSDVPGPGIYGSGVEMNAFGIYTLSTIENSKAAAWSPTKQRF